MISKVLNLKILLNLKSILLLFQQSYCNLFKKLILLSKVQQCRLELWVQLKHYNLQAMNCKALRTLLHLHHQATINVLIVQIMAHVIMMANVVVALVGLCMIVVWVILKNKKQSKIIYKWSISLKVNLNKILHRKKNLKLSQV